MLVPVPGSAHPCGSGAAPARGAFLLPGSGVAGESYCGQVAYGSEPFVWMPGAPATVTEFVRGEFDYMTPLSVLPGPTPRMLVAADLCPPVTGSCVSVLAIATTTAAPTVLESMSTAGELRDRSDSGWSVGFGAIGGGTSAWRGSPDGTVEELDAPTGWGESVDGVSASGVAVGSAYISNQQRGVVWGIDGAALVLASPEPGTASRAAGVGIDGSVVGQAGGRAVWWPSSSVGSGAPGLELLPVGSQSEATHLAGNPSSAGPLGWAAFGTLSYGAKLFRSNGSTAVELPAPAGLNVSGLKWIDAPTPLLAVALGHDQVYQPIALLWTPQHGLERLQRRIALPAPAAVPADLMPIDADAAGIILLSDGFDGVPMLAVPLRMGDATGDAQVNGSDLGALLSSWGPVSANTAHPADFDGDSVVGALDLAMLLGAWE